jgi:hypothetical protein
MASKARGRRFAVAPPIEAAFSIDSPLNVRSLSILKGLEDVAA